MRFSFYFLLFIFFSWGSGISLYCQQYGLYFASFDATIDRRTSIELFTDKAERVKDNFELSFDISFHETRQFRYGYVFRIIFNENHNIDLIYGNRTGGQRDFSIIMGTRQSDIAFNIDPSYLQNNWVSFNIQFLLSEKRIVFSERDTLYIDDKADLQNPSSIKIYFGLCNEKNFESTDVPPLMIRDIKINKNSKLKYHWPLNEVEGNIAKDIIRNEKAKVINPHWLKRSHLQWKKINDMHLSGFTQVTYNQEIEQVYLIGKDKLIIYQVNTNAFDTVYYSSNPIFLEFPYQAVFDPNNEVIISYNPDKKQRFFIDPFTGDITQEELESTIRLDYLHHNKYFNPDSNFLYIINGYGHYMYKNTLLRCNIQDNIWEDISCSGELPAPRYLAASGYLYDTLYILGGYGSSSGSQKLNPRYYYDLFSLSLKDMKYEEIRTYDDPDEGFSFANSMIIDSTTRHFYALTFPKFRYQSYLTLVRGSLDKKELEKLGDSIPYFFNDINSYADLFFFPNSNKMLAITILSEKNQNSSASIYSIDFPPISVKTPLTESKPYWLYLTAGFLIFSIILIWRIIIRRKKPNLTYLNSNALSFANTIHSLDDDSQMKPVNSIYFFGGFQVFNRDGIDITKKFTRLLKELYLLIFLNSTRNEKGISSEKIIEFLWFDKSEKSGRNNLSVNITKLKNILSELDGCDLSHSTGYWKIINNYKIIYNDYYVARNILKSENHSIEAIKKLIDITTKGPFLINVEYEWLDAYKAKVSDRIVDTLISYSERLNQDKDSELMINLADCIFNFDIVNEEAMFLKCRTQYLQGKHSLAKNAYDAFCNEFKILYGENYAKSFNDIIKNGA
jgi:two-component SAPR family response regulator